MQRNKYIKRSHISEKKTQIILRCFASDCTANRTAEISGVSRVSVNKLFMKLRIRLCQLSPLSETTEPGEDEVDESYFGAKRVRGKRGHGAAGKTPVFGLIKRGGGVYVQIVKNCSKAELMPIIKGNILKGSTVHSDGWKSYDGLILNGYDHYRVYHSKNEFARGKSHVNGIEAFWSAAKRRMAKFNGCAAHTFVLHLKESEFRYNFRQRDFYLFLLRELRKNPL